VFTNEFVSHIHPKKRKRLHGDRYPPFGDEVSKLHCVTYITFASFHLIFLVTLLILEVFLLMGITISTTISH
jgi:hypothetical protein